MSKPRIDFSHLSPPERIELAEQLWDSLAPGEIVPTAEQAAELRARRAELSADGDLGEPWEQILSAIEEHRL